MPGRDPIGIILTAAILFLFWIVLSGYLDWIHITMGLISSLVIVFLTEKSYILSFFEIQIDFEILIIVRN